MFVLPFWIAREHGRVTNVFQSQKQHHHSLQTNTTATTERKKEMVAKVLETTG
jgi:hypothetical protein